jgi:hypothetical protein
LTSLSTPYSKYNDFNGNVQHLLFGRVLRFAVTSLLWHLNSGEHGLV